MSPRTALRALTPREASIFASLTDALVAPLPPLPAVRDTDAVVAFDAWLARAPRLNRLALRSVLYAAEVVPYALGARARLRRLEPDRRASLVGAAEGSRSSRIRQLAKAIRSMAFLCYYGDDGVMLTLGYDAEANARRGRELRAREGRP